MIKKLLTIVLLFCSVNVHSALVIGTNCVFVTVAPSGDPGAGDNGSFDSYAIAGMFTAPADGTVTQIGLWVDSGNEESQYNFAIYTDDSSKPDVVVGSIDVASKPGTQGVWHTSGVMSASVTGTVVYHIAVQLDNTSTPTDIDYTTDAGETENYKGSGATELTDPWGSSSGSLGRLLAIYALYTPAGAPATGEAVPQIWILE